MNNTNSIYEQQKILLSNTLKGSKSFTLLTFRLLLHHMICISEMSYNDQNNLVMYLKFLNIDLFVNRYMVFILRYGNMFSSTLWRNTLYLELLSQYFSA